MPRSCSGSRRCASDWAAADLVGTDERADTDLAAHDFTAPTVLVVGNETHGLSRAYRDACDAVVRIPMSGSASSLNVSVAASIAIYEVVRQRARGVRASGHPSPRNSLASRSTSR